MGKRVVALVLVCLVLLSGSALAERPVVRVGYIDDPYLCTQHEDGTYSGVLYEFMQMVGAYAGVRMEYVQGNIRENYDRLRNKEIDMLPGVMQTAKGKRNDFLLTSHRMSETTMQAAMRDRAAIAEGRRLRVGYFAPTSDISLLEPMLAHQMAGYAPGYELVPMTITGQLDREFAAGNIDGVITNTLHHVYDAEDNFSLMDENVYIAFHPDNAELAQRIDTAMQDVLLSVPDFSTRLKTRPGVSFTPAERQYLEQLGSLTAFVSPGQRPYTWYENGQPQGMIADIVKLISNDIGVPIEVREAGSNNDMMAAFENGDADFIADFNSDPNWGEEHHAIVTAPYLRLTYVGVVRRNEPLPEHPMVACVRGHYYTHAFVEKQYPEEQRVYYDTIQDCLQAVSNGAADITYEKSVTAQYDITNGEFYNLSTSGAVVYSHGVSMALHADVDPRLLSILNKAITHLDAEMVQSVINKHIINKPQDRGLMEIVLRNPMAAVQSLIVALAGVLVVAGGYLLMRSRYVRQLRVLAYINDVTGMHTLSWFRKYAFKEVENRHAARRAGRLWLMTVTTQRIMFLRESYDLDLLIASIKQKINDARERYPYFLVDAVNAELTGLYVLCELPEGLTPEQLVTEMQTTENIIAIGDIKTSLNYRVGFCPIPTHTIREEDFPKLIEWALLAQTEAVKRDEPCVVFDNALRDAVMQQQQIEHYMHKALAEYEFKLWLQPKYDIRTHRTVGAEALVRWQSPELGLLLPGRFVDIFENNGFIVNLDYYMLNYVLQIQQLRYDQGRPLIPISVNQSGLHISEEGYLDRMREILAKYDLPPRVVDLEITETAFIDFTTKDCRANASAIIQELQRMGYVISMDDFCTGYSSIAMLRNLPMDIMKIDRSMLLAAEADPRSEQILRYVINMGTALGMKVICEGIETLEQEQLLLDNGCFYGQGFLFGRPMTLDDFMARLDKEQAVQPPEGGSSLV